MIGPSNTATKIRVPISDTGHMAQISTANPEISYQLSCVFMQIYVCSCKVYYVHAKFMHEYLKYQYQSTSPSVVATDNFG